VARGGAALLPGDARTGAAGVRDRIVHHTQYANLRSKSRHTGNHIAAATGASLRELMGRMGQSTTRAAVIYQHRTSERDRLIAEAVSKLVEQELSRLTGSSGAQRARHGYETP
jgi:hypothetical protein